MFVRSSEKTKKKYSLNYKQKLHLAEILLIVGALLSALHLPEQLIWIFMLFVMFSIVYIIIIQQEEKHVKLIGFVSFLLSICFAGILVYHFGYSFGKAIEGSSNYVQITQIITMIYYFLLSFIIYKALAVGKLISFKKVDKKMTLSKTIWDGDEAYIEPQNK